MAKLDQLIALATSLLIDVEEFWSSMRAHGQQPHYSLDVQGASHPSSHCFTTHAVFNTYSPLHYDGDGGDVPFSPTKEGGDIPEMDVDGMEKNSCNKVDTTLIYKRRSGRMVKLSAILKSPFVDNCQKQFKKLTWKERLVENYVFGNGMDEEYVQFR